ncbi:MAG: hypothetical protein WB565_13320 [Acidimicrobiales bacterium]
MALAVALGPLCASLVPRRGSPSRRRVQLRIDREAFRAEAQIDWAVSRAVEEMLAAARNYGLDNDRDKASGPLPPLGG